MNKKSHSTLFVLAALAVMLLVIAFVLGMFFFYEGSIPVLQPKGMIALKERKLIILATALMLIVVIPVFILIFVFAWRYRADNDKAKYAPDWHDNKIAEAIWWGLPFVIIIVLSIVTYVKSHELDPFRSIDKNKEPLRIQVVALQWKWLFIYPEQQVASVNWVELPEKTPINFEITSDAPMNSFWIPQLSGQIFAMPGMRTELHLVADKEGSFRGSSANISGHGFAGMTFTARASSQEGFDQWVQQAKQSSTALNLAEYQKLALPSQNDPVVTYTLEKEDLFDWIIMKYMMPMPDSEPQKAGGK